VRHFNDVKNWPEDIQKIAKLAENDKNGADVDQELEFWWEKRRWWQWI
jgi:hypothetical protein